MDESTNAPAMSENTDQADKASNDTNKQLMKPDKIVPCPRCNSMDTKFCYYNNYNVNQPRYFCRNCQRYWTAGGTMRNVPVGAGRRKNKTSASRYCQITVSEALNGVHQPGMKTNGTVLTFGSDYPLCDSRAVENGDDRSSGSTVTTSSMEDRSKKHLNGFNNQMQMQCFQWPYMWNPAFPMPIYPHPYWNGAPIPWNGPQVPTQMSSGSNTNSPTLGKHTRDGEIISPSHINRSSRTSTTTSTSTVLIPKTLRIDDPDEAAKSSIWTTLGIKKDKGDPIIRKGFFNSFQFMRAEKNDCEVEAPQALFMANPVALCRSFSFQEKA